MFCGRERRVKWFLDSGASDHLAREKELFVELHKLPKPIEIAVAKDGEFIVAEHAGTVKMFSVVGGRKPGCGLFSTMVKR